MGFLDFLNPQEPMKAVSQDDPRVWTSWNGVQNVSGQHVDASTAMQLSAVFGCVRVIAESLATLPIIAYEKSGEKDRKRVSDNYLAKLIKKPNAWQTQMEFVELLTGWALLQGNGYAQIVPGNGSFAGQLIPLDPGRMQVEQLASGRLRYKYTLTNGTHRVLTQDEVFHLRGIGGNGITGYSVISLAANSMGIGLAAEKLSARQFSGKPMMSGILSHPGELSGEAGRRVVGDFRTAHSGPDALGVAILEEGMTWTSTGVTNVDAEFMTTRKFQVTEIARWFRVPPHMIQDLERSTFSNIESQDINFVRHTLQPWATRWEQAIRRDLILDDQQDDLYVEFLFDSLLRGETNTRYAAYQIAINNGIMAPNEVRRLENLQPVEGGDVLWIPLNLRELDKEEEPPEAAQAPLPPFINEDDTAVDEEEEDEQEGTQDVAEAFMRGIVRESASRIVRREATRIGRWNETKSAWGEWIKDIYESNATIIVQNLHIDESSAINHCNQVAEELMALDPEEAKTIVATEEWVNEKIEALMNIIGV